MNEFELKIAELEEQITRLDDKLAKKNKELERYQHLSTRYKRLKKTSAAYNRDRVILLVFSLLLICVICYMGIKINNAKIEQQKLYEMYKTKNGAGPNPDIYVDPL